MHNDIYQYITVKEYLKPKLKKLLLKIKVNIDYYFNNINKRE